MNTLLTADLHFDHENIMKFCPENRGRFKDVDHMNEFMVNEWNNAVCPEDTVYILGDVSFGKTTKAIQILQRMNGSKILIKGNHDHKTLKSLEFFQCFESVHDYLEIRYEGHNIVLFHYPIIEWNRMHRGSIHFFGHVHGDKTGLEPYRARDVGYDATGKVVWRMEDAIKDALKGEIREHH